MIYWRQEERWSGEGRLQCLVCYKAGHENRAMDLEKRRWQSRSAASLPASLDGMSGVLSENV